MFSGQGAFTFSVYDDGPIGAEHRSDTEHHAADVHGRATRPTTKKAERYRFRRHVCPVGSERIPVVQGYVHRPRQPDFDRFLWNTSRDAFTNLDMTRSADNLQITFTTNTGSGVFTILNQYETGNRSAIEEMQFADNVQFGAATLSGRYNLSATDGGSGNDIVVGGPGCDTRSRRRRPGRAVRRRRQRHPVRRGLAMTSWSAGSATTRSPAATEWISTASPKPAARIGTPSSITTSGLKRAARPVGVARCQFRTRWLGQRRVELRAGRGRPAAT